jgi:Family of unknown function (DUF6339)
MPLSIFRENFVNRLRAAIRQNLPLYRSNECWIESISGGATASFETNVEPLEELTLSEPDEEDFKDVENAIHLHRSLSFLTPLQARDPRLWTKLAHVECWDYMRKRWDVERYGRDKGKVERFVLSRYFVAQNQSRALLRNGLARLWWYGHVTHDAERENPYELTGVLLSTLDIAQQILERNFGRIEHVRTGFLEFLLTNKKKLLGPGDKKRMYIRQLAKYLNLRGGVTLLDSLRKSEVADFLGEDFSRIEAEPVSASAGE